MKTFVFATCLLITVVHSFNREKVKDFYHELHECAKELPKSPNEPNDLLHRINCLYCFCLKRGIIDKHDVFKKEVAFKYCNDLITDPAKVEKCKKIVTDCTEKENQGSLSNKEKSTAVIRCAIKHGACELISHEEL